jgi:hypothetical protein
VVRLITCSLIRIVQSGMVIILKCRLVSLAVSTIVMMLILTVSGCINNNTNVPTPTPIPSTTPISSTTPSPTSTFPGGDTIVGLWEGSKNSAKYSIQFNNDGTLLYNEAGNMAQGFWQKIDNKQYKIRILASNPVIALNNNMTRFNWEERV